MGSEETNESQGGNDTTRTHWSHIITAALLGVMGIAVLYYCIRRCTYHRKKQWARQRTNLEEGLAKALEAPRMTPNQPPPVAFPMQTYNPQAIPMIAQHPLQTYPMATIDEIDCMVIPKPIARIQPAPKPQLKFPGKLLAELAEMMTE